MNFKRSCLVVFLMFLFTTVIIASLLSCKGDENNNEIDRVNDNRKIEFDRSDMGTVNTKDFSSWENLNDEIKGSFENSYNTERNKRGVFENYYKTIGPAAMLGYLEFKNPYCHSQAHDLGKTIFAKLLDFNQSLIVCGNRCTNGCMHGVVSEAFGHEKYKDVIKSVNAMCGAIPESFSDKKYEEVAKTMNDFCKQGDMSKLHKEGNCAHAMGHALMMLSDNDIKKAIQACKEFPEKAMGYYCATGVFMEYADGIVQKINNKEDFKRQSMHYPCDAYKEYPAACYRYMLNIIGYELKADAETLIQECRKLGDSQRGGCFHGLGRMYSKKIAEDPHLINKLCLEDDSEDNIMCIEGAIEKLSDYNENDALKVCSLLLGKNKTICENAAREKMYRLDKPSIELYCQ